MPIDLYLKKKQYTCVKEDEAAFDNYSRKVLTNMRADAPLWEDEFTRRENQSQEKLNVWHHGRRSEKVPDLPDGTFMDWEFLEHETRAANNEPDWQQLKEDKAYRNRYYKYRNDEDYTRAQRQINPHEADERKRESFDYLAKRWNVFSTSLEGANPYSSVRLDPRHYTELVEANRVGIPIDGMTLMNRRHIAKELEEMYPIGWDSTTDHEYKIAYYSSSGKKGLGPNQVDSRKNRTNAYLEHDILTPLPDNHVPKYVVMDIINVTNQKISGIKSLQGAQYGEDLETLQSKRKRIEEDLTKARRYTQASAVAPAHTKVGEKMHRQSGKKFNPNKWDTNQRHKSIFNPLLASSIAMKTRRVKLHDFEDLRNEVEQTAAQNAIFILDQTKQTAMPSSVPNESMHNTKSGQATSDSSLTIKNYRNFTKMREMAQDYVPYKTSEDIHKGDARSNDVRSAVQLTTMDRHAAQGDQTSLELGVMAPSHRVKPGRMSSGKHIVPENEQESMLDL